VSKVAILLAVYNGDAYLDAALESVCSQSYKDWELVVVENGSTDGTFSILEKWASKDSRIQIHSLPEKGKNKAFNYAYSKSKADFVCFVAADDVLHTDSIAKRLAPLLADQDINFTTCLLQTISGDEKFNGLIFPKNRNSPNYSGGSIFFSNALAAKVFPIPEHLPNEDVWTALHLKHFGKGKHINACLYYYRIHGANSYGYHVDFATKRKGFLVRLKAFELFLDKYRAILTQEKLIYLEGFCKARNAAELFQIRKIAVSELPLKDKVLFIYYCSPLLFKLKQRLFKLLSGKLDLV